MKLLRHIRIDVIDAITAIRAREWSYALPACIFRRIYKDN
jgi:hypothetical protein